MLIRDYRPEDLGQVLQLWERSQVPEGGDGLAVEQAVDLLSAERAVALVAETDGRLVGAVLGAVSPVSAWIHRLSLLPAQPDEQEIAERLLDELEARFAQAVFASLPP